MKDTVRKEILKKRMAQSEEDVAEKSAAIRQRLIPFWDREDIKAIMVYLPFRKEVDLLPLIEAAWAKGKKVAIPVCKENCTILPSYISDFQKDLRTGNMTF